jgi:subtilisin-like proprotein convertase family protein
MPNSDAYLELPFLAPLDATGYELFKSSDGSELKRPFTLVGFGRSGTGETGDTLKAGVKRGATNRFDVYRDPDPGNRVPEESQMLLDFDCPVIAGVTTKCKAAVADYFRNHTGYSDEGFPADADSGGPAFIDGKIAGIMKGAVNPDHPGPLRSDIDFNAPDRKGVFNSTFGEVASYIRVADFADDFIERIMRQPYDLVLDMNYQSKGNDGVGDSIILQRNEKDQLEITVQGLPPFIEPNTKNIKSIKIIGSGDDDTLTIDFANGDPTFGKGLIFEGGEGANTLVLAPGLRTFSFSENRLDQARPSFPAPESGTITIEDSKTLDIQYEAVDSFQLVLPSVSEKEELGLHFVLSPFPEASMGIGVSARLGTDTEYVELQPGSIPTSRAVVLPVTKGTAEPRELSLSLVQASLLSRVQVGKFRFAPIPRSGVNVVAVLDRSCSMGTDPECTDDPTDKLAQAKSAAVRFVNLLNDGDAVGVAAFTKIVRNGTDEFPIAWIGGDDDARQAAISFIRSITVDDGDSSFSGTSIGAGMQSANIQLETLGDVPGRAMIVLSDGMNNAPPDPLGVVGQVDEDVRIYTIGYGAAADAGVLKAIARLRNGQYFAAGSGADLPRIYNEISGDIRNEQSVLQSTGSVTPGTFTSRFATIDPAAAEMTIGLTWPGSDLDLELVAPSGVIIDHQTAVGDPHVRLIEDETSEFFKIRYPEPGNWEVRVHARDVPESGEPFELFVRIATELALVEPTPKSEFRLGRRVLLSVTLDGAATTRDVRVEAQIRSDLASLTPPAIVRLYDDGKHGDGKANDGIFANYVVMEDTTNFIDYVASGTSQLGFDFFRRIRREMTGIGRTSADTPVATVGDKTVKSVLVIADDITIQDVDVHLDITHTYNSDLTVSLVSPAGTKVKLFDRVGRSGDNFFGTILDDEAGTRISDGRAPFTGRFRPMEPLSAFDGQNAKGNWTLEIHDRDDRDTGELRRWSLSIQGDVTSTPNVSVWYDGQEVASGDAIDFGSVAVGGQANAQVLRIVNNDPTQVLGIGGVVLPAGLTLQESPAGILAPGQYRELTLAISSREPGPISGVIEFLTAHSNGTPKKWSASVVGTAVEPEPTPRLAGRVWIDRNGNGLFDDDDYGLNGVVLYLASPTSDGTFTGNDDRLPLAYTDRNGYYEFDNLGQGSYQVRVDPWTLPRIVGQTFDPDGVHDSMTVVDLSENRQQLNVNFAYQVELDFVVSDFGEDTDDDGLFDFLSVALKVSSDVHRGELQFQGSLRDPEGALVSESSVTHTIGDDESIVRIDFRGSDVYQAGLEYSYYEFELDVLDADGDLLFSLDDAFWTSYYSFNEFAPPEGALSVSINEADDQADPTNELPIVFTVVFSEPVSGFDETDVVLDGSAPGKIVQSVVPIGGSATRYTVTVSGLTGSGDVRARVPAGVLQNTEGNFNEASISKDNVVTYDLDPPTVSIDQDVTQTDPARGLPILFRVVFNEPIEGFSAEDVLVTGTAPGEPHVTISPVGDDRSYVVAVSGFTGSGLVEVNVPAGVAADLAGNANLASTSTDNAVEFEISPLTVLVSQSEGQNDPTNTSPIRFTAAFSKPVTGLETGHVVLTGTASNAVVESVQSISDDNRMYSIVVSVSSGGGTVTASIPAGVVEDGEGNTNAASTSTDSTVTYDADPPIVTLNQAENQSDPTSASPVVFTAIFNEAITDFTAADVHLSGTAPGKLVATVAAVSDDGKEYTIEVSGMTGSGTVIATIPAGAVRDLAGNASNASIHTDNTVSYVAVSGTGSISGFVYIDVNNDGIRSEVERGLPNIPVSIVGSINRVVYSREDGSYRFDGLPAGRYTVSQTQPLAFRDGKESIGRRASGTVGDNQFVDIEVGAYDELVDYNFGVRGLRPELITLELLYASTPSTGQLLQQLDVLGGERWIKIQPTGPAILTVAVPDTQSLAIEVYTDGWMPVVLGSEQKLVNARVDAGETYVVHVYANDQGSSTTATLAFTADVDTSFAPFENGQFTNPTNRFDVNGDGWVTPLDVLMTIVELNSRGPRFLLGPHQSPPYFDVNNDGYASALDTLQVLNWINRPYIRYPVGGSTAGGEGEAAESRILAIDVLASSGYSLGEAAAPRLAEPDYSLDYGPQRLAPAQHVPEIDSRWPAETRSARGTEQPAAPIDTDDAWEFDLLDLEPLVEDIASLPFPRR